MASPQPSHLHFINLFIRGVSGKGPIRSTPMVCHTSPLTGIGWSRSLVKFSIHSERTNHAWAPPAFLEAGAGGQRGGGEGRQL